MPHSETEAQTCRAAENSRRLIVLLLGVGGVLLFFAMRESAQTRRAPRIVTELTDVIDAVRFSPDSRTLAIARGSRDENRVELWDTATGTLRHTIRGFDGAIWSLSYAPDGKTLVTASGGVHPERIAEKRGAHDGRPFVELKWWDARNGELKQRVELPGEDLLSVTALYSPDGRQLATVEQRTQTMVEIFDNRGAASNTGGFPRSAPVGRSILFGADLKLLDAVTGDLKLKLKGELSYGIPLMRGFSRRDPASTFLASQRQPLIYSPDAQLLAAWNNSEIKLWNTATGEEVRKLKDFKGRLGGVGFSPDGRTLAAAITKFTLKKNQADYKSEVRTWDIATGKPRQVIPVTTQSVSSLAFALNGQQVLIGGLQRDETQSFATLELVDLHTGSLGKLIGKSEATTSSIVLSPNGGMLAFQADASTVNLVDTGDWKIRQTFEANSDGDSHDTASGRFLLTVKSVQALAFSPDGKTLAGEIENGGINLWDPRTGEIKEHLAESVGQTTLIEISSDARTVVEFRDNASLNWWDTARGEETVLDQKDSNITALGVSFDGKQLAVAHRDRIAMLEVGTRKLTATLISPDREINQLAFSADGKRLAAAAEDGAIEVWNLESRQIQTTLNGAGAVTALRFAPGSNTLASASNDGDIKVWNLQTAAPVMQLKKHKGAVNAIAFSPDGNIMATGGDDRTVILWETASGKSRKTLKGHDLTVTSLAFSPDGMLLAAGSGNASVVLWNVRTGKLNRVLK
jgi:WD40 repeat protein